jgi:hypothetical protein
MKAANRQAALAHNGHLRVSHGTIIVANNSKVALIWAASFVMLKSD